LEEDLPKNNVWTTHIATNHDNPISLDISTCFDLLLFDFPHVLLRSRTPSQCALAGEFGAFASAEGEPGRSRVVIPKSPGSTREDFGECVRDIGSQQPGKGTLEVLLSKMFRFVFIFLKSELVTSLKNISHVENTRGSTIPKFTMFMGGIHHQSI